MHTQTLEQSPRNHRGGQVSYLLMAKGQFGSQNLAITWVEGGRHSGQAAHAHTDQEQVYVIIRGRGVITVGKEQQEVRPGTLVFVPQATPHAIRNIGEEPLAYVSATAPPFERSTTPPFAFEDPPIPS